MILTRYFHNPETNAAIRQRLLALCKEGEYGIFSPPMDAATALYELSDFFLGEDWYTPNPVSAEQTFTEIVYAIQTLFRKFETKKKIRQRLLALCKEGNYGICPPPMDAKSAIYELQNFFLGKDWYTSNPVSEEQIFIEIVYAIETRYKRFKAPK